MPEFKKYMVVPYKNPENHIEIRNNIPKNKEKVTSVRKTNIIKQRSIEKMEKILRIVLALAKINGYDSNGRIRSGSTFLENTNIISLINHIIVPQKILFGEAEFIQLLQEAHIDPSLIVNENIRSKVFRIPKETPVTVTHNDVLPEKFNKEPDIIRTGVKREAEESEEEPLRKKKLSNWTIPDSDDE